MVRVTLRRAEFCYQFRESFDNRLIVIWRNFSKYFFCQTAILRRKHCSLTEKKLWKKATLSTYLATASSTCLASTAISKTWDLAFILGSKMETLKFFTSTKRLKKVELNSSLQKLSFYLKWWWCWHQFNMVSENVSFNQIL